MTTSDSVLPYATGLSIPVYKRLTAQVCLGVDLKVLRVVNAGTFVSTVGRELDPGQVQNTAGKGLS